MKSNHLYGCLLSLISGATLLATACAAQDLVYVGTQAQAIARAQAEGKMILTKFGRVACSDCSGMESRFRGMAPPLKQWILASYIWWQVDIDTNSEYLPYAAGLNGSTLPIMCFVDPAKPGKYMARYNGLIQPKSQRLFWKKSSPRAAIQATWYWMLTADVEPPFR